MATMQCPACGKTDVPAERGKPKIHESPDGNVCYGVKPHVVEATTGPIAERKGSREPELPFVHPPGQ